MKETIKQSIAIVDIETTGPNIGQTDDIIQLAAWIFHPDGTIDEQMTYVKPTCPIPPHISELTGIDAETVADAPMLKDIIDDWYRLLAPCILLAHNLAFDLNILTTVFDQYDYIYRPMALDTVKLARIFLPKAPAFNLTDLSYYLNIEYSDAHDALMDVKMTAYLVQAMAGEVVKLPVKLRQQFQPWVAELSHDEVIFLERPDWFNFQLDIPYRDSQLPAQPVQTDSQAYLLGQWAYEEGNQHDQLLVENPGYGISQATVEGTIDAIEKQNQTAIVLVADFTQADQLAPTFSANQVDLLFHSDAYLHKTAFNRLLRDFKPENVGERDRVIIIATAFWLATSQTGLYYEINEELWAHDLLKKYVPKLLRRPNAFYQKAFKAALASTNVITSYRAVLQLTDHQFQQLVDKKAKWVIRQMEDFVIADRRHQQAWFDVSKFIRTQRRHLDWLYTATTDKSQAIEWAQQLLDLGHQLSQLGQATLMNHWQDSGPSKQRIYLGKQTYQKVQQIAEKMLPVINQQLSDLTEGQQSQSLKVQLQPALAFCKQVKRATPDQYLTVSGEYLNGDVYHIRFTHQPLVVSKKSQYRLQQIDYIGFLNGYGLKKEWGQVTAWLPEDTWHYQSLPKLTYHQPLTAHCLPAYTALGDSDYSQQLKEIGQLTLNYIQTQRDLGVNRLLIVAANEAQVEALKQAYLKATDIPHVYIEGLHGTVRRLKRRSLEKEDLVLVVSLASFIEETWENGHRFDHLALMRLPFRHSQTPAMQGMGDYFTYDESQIFDQLVLPDMVNRLRYFARHCHDQMEISEFDLLDDRVFTKYYAQRLQSLCDGEIKFDIRDE